ncbi:hypothetical protein XELAEV_18035268mg [Xenopus laevis]|uniref:Uncharacterized protein n=1 Tax=Xenopus laevis TaxID=8355 RepID=A0A974CFG4_XENLA|nr:hypothetical protein XELAEV_18035268mg [Xenopus laevis]
MLGITDSLNPLPANTLPPLAPCLPTPCCYCSPRCWKSDLLPFPHGGQWTALCPQIFAALDLGLCDPGLHIF